MKKLILTFLASFSLLFASAPAALAFSCDDPNLSTTQALQCGANNGSSTSVQDSAKAASQLNTTMGRIINVLSMIVGIIAVIMVIVGGLRYVASAGNQEAVSSAKRTIIYALVGVIIVALAQTLARFVVNRST